VSNTRGAVRHQEQERRDRAVFQLALLQHVQGQTTPALQQLTALLARLQEELTPSALLLLPLVEDWQGVFCLRQAIWRPCSSV
jgi:hypothetical protein